MKFSTLYPMIHKIIFSALILVLTGMPGFSQLHFEKSEYIARREKLIEKIPDGIVILRGASLPNGYSQFYQYNNMMYFSGLEIPDIILVIDGVDKSSTLFFTISENEARGEGIPMELVYDPGKYNGIDNKLPMEDFYSFLKSKFEKVKTAYTPLTSGEFPGDVSREKTRKMQKSMTEDEWDGRLIREQQFAAKLKEHFPEIEVKDCFIEISDLRKIKSKAEIEVMREAGRIGVAAHRTFIKAAGVDVTELELANLFEFTCRKEGAQGLAYNTIIMSGENMPYGHYHRYNRTLQDGDFVVLDAGPDYKYYDIDFSTSFPASGKFSQKQKELYELANAIREVCIKSYMPGITLGDVGQNVKKYLVDNGYDPDERRFQGFIRYGGYNHSVGMAVHDGMGTFNGPEEVLQPGFVFACDINMYYRDLEICIRLEDTVVITDDGCEVFSDDLPRTIEEVENLMNNR